MALITQRFGHAILSAVICLYSISLLTSPSLANGASIRIIGGEDVPVGEMPWQVALFPTSKGPAYAFCGGVLIGTGWILTAAHCFVGRQPEQISIFLGSVNLTDMNAELRQIECPLPDPCKVLSPPGTVFDPAIHDQDIVLVKLDRSVGLSDKLDIIDPINRVEEPVLVVEGQKAYVSGWGRSDNPDDAWPDHLQAAEVPFVTRDRCQALHLADLTQLFSVTEYMLCAGSDQADSCHVDSGGPLVVTDGSSAQLAGLVSWGPRGACADAQRPGVYTRVAVYHDWIRSIVPNECSYRDISQGIC